MDTNNKFGTFTATSGPALVNLDLGFIPDYFEMIGECTATGDIVAVKWFRTMGAATALKYTAIVDSGTTGSESCIFITSGGISEYNAAGVVTPTRWKASTVTALGKVVHPTTLNGYFYECTTAGTTHSVEPVTWGTTVGGTTSEGGGAVVWTCIAQGDLTNGASVTFSLPQGVTIPAALLKASTKYHYFAKTGTVPA